MVANRDTSPEGIGFLDSSIGAIKIQFHIFSRGHLPCRQQSGHGDQSGERQY